MTRLFAFAVPALLLGLQPGLAAAESLNPALDRQQQETQVLASVTMPLGQAADRRMAAPRFELRVRNGWQDAAPNRPSNLFDQQQWRESRIGFTFAKKPDLLVNGMPLPESDRRDGISTLGLVAIGAGAVAVLVVISASSLDFDNVGETTR